MNMQSKGEVTLKSANATDNPVINPNYMSHPYDRRMMTLAIRETMRFSQSGVIKQGFKEHVMAPKSQSDEDIHVCSSVSNPPLSDLPYLSTQIGGNEIAGRRLI